MLDVRPERVADRRGHTVGAFAGCFGDSITGIVDDIDVVTVAADAPLGLRDVTVSGSGRCDGFSFTRTGAFTVTAAFQALKEQAFRVTLTPA